MQFGPAMRQLSFLYFELTLIANKRPWRYLSGVFCKRFHAVAAYRLQRALFLAFGRGWSVCRVLLSPVLFCFRPWSGGCEVHYRAEVGRGLQILHPSLGVVVSAKAVVGENCVLTGGNCIGSRKAVEPGQLRIGDNVVLGVNAVVLGPIRIGNNVQIGAGAVVMHDVAENQTVGGIPAKV